MVKISCPTCAGTGELDDPVTYAYICELECGHVAVVEKFVSDSPPAMVQRCFDSEHANHLVLAPVTRIHGPVISE